MKGTLQHKVAERQADLTAKREALAAVLAENSALAARIATQTVSKADVARMANERSKQVRDARVCIALCKGFRQWIDRCAGTCHRHCRFDHPEGSGCSQHDAA